jgi:hypothetical protein
MNKFRLLCQAALSAIAIPLGFNDKLTQFCDRCGRSHWRMVWWDETNVVWETVVGNINGCRHGCYCPACFTAIAHDKGVRILWVPIIEQEVA